MTNAKANIHSNHRLVLAFSNCTRAVVEIATGGDTNDSSVNQKVLRTREGVPLDHYTRVPRGTPDDQLEWLLKQSIEQKKQEKKEK